MTLGFPMSLTAVAAYIVQLQKTKINRKQMLIMIFVRYYTKLTLIHHFKFLSELVI